MKLDDHTEKPTQKKKKIKCKKDLNVKDLKPKIEANRAIKPLDIDLSIFFLAGMGRFDFKKQKTK